MTYPDQGSQRDESVLAEQLKLAESVLKKAHLDRDFEIEHYALNRDYEDLRWFILPQDISQFYGSGVTPTSTV